MSHDAQLGHDAQLARDAKGSAAASSPRGSAAASSPRGSAADRHCIIGAGPSGLAQARAFAALGIEFDWFERHTEVGGLWDLENPGTPMYESAHLISSKTMSAFVGYPMPSDYPDYPSRAQVLAYLRGFAERYGLGSLVQLGTAVESVRPLDDGFVVTVSGEQRRYRGVVCATGTTWKPRLPDIPGSFSGRVRHSQEYKSPSEFDGQDVLIVGLGNSGADIACDAAQRARRTLISVRRGYHFIPKHIFGKPADVFAQEGPHLPPWLELPIFGFLQRLLVGDTERLGMPKPNHRILESHPLMNDQLLHHLRHGDASIVPNVERFDGDEVVFVGGRRERVDQVLFATGYQRHLPYLDAAVLNGDDPTGEHFLTCFSLRHPGLCTVGSFELNGALAPAVDRLALLVAYYFRARLEDSAAAFEALIRDTRVDLTGGRRLIDSSRHRNYCDDVAFAKATKRVFKKMRWALPQPEMFERLSRPSR